MTGEQVRIAFNNKKSKLLAKNYIKRTGNVAISLNEDEKTFLRFLEGPDAQNPAITSMPGAASTLQMPVDEVSAGSKPPPSSTMPRTPDKRPPPPPTNSTGKRARYDVLIDEQIKYFKRKNEQFETMENLSKRVEYLEGVVASLRSQLSCEYQGSIIDQIQFSSEQ